MQKPKAANFVIMNIEKITKITEEMKGDQL